MTDYPAALGEFEGTGLIESYDKGGKPPSISGYFEAQTEEDAQHIRDGDFREGVLFTGRFHRHDGHKFTVRHRAMLSASEAHDTGTLIAFHCNGDPEYLEQHTF